MMTRINDDRLEAHCLFSTGGAYVLCAVLLAWQVCLRAHYQVDHLSLACLHVVSYILLG